MRAVGIELARPQPSAMRVFPGVAGCSGQRRATRNPLLGLAVLAALLLLSSGAPARGDEVPIPGAPVASQTDPTGFKVCAGQTYALCAAAKCFVFNGLAYCKCDVEFGDSISLPLKFDDGQNVCTTNAEGPKNGYMVSTFSVPASVVAPNGDKALYTCRARSSDGAYGQCDGGICFTSTEGQSFPGFEKPLKKDEIICSCPITVADPAAAKAGFQIAGPYPCQPSHFDYCKSASANTKTGSTIYVGAPIGTARLLAQMLYGSVPPLHRCTSP